MKKRRGRSRFLGDEINEDVIQTIKNNTDNEAADKLGVSRRTIIRLRQRLNIKKKRGGARVGAGRKKLEDRFKKPVAYPRNLTITDRDMVKQCPSAYAYQPSKWDNIKGQYIKKPRFKPTAYSA